MTTKLEDHILGIQIIDQVADQLNAIAQVQSIPDGVEEIWDVIHNLTDDEWRQIFEALGWFKDQGATTESDDHTIEDAHDKWFKAYQLGKMWVGHKHNIDPATGKIKKSGHKHEIWSVWMRMREIVNRFNGVYIPNGPQRTQVKLSNEFHTLFE
jgi:hypothetical protein